MSDMLLGVGAAILLWDAQLCEEHQRTGLGSSTLERHGSSFIQKQIGYPRMPSQQNTARDTHSASHEKKATEHLSAVENMEDSVNHWLATFLSFPKYDDDAF